MNLFLPSEFYIVDDQFSYDTEFKCNSRLLTDLKMLHFFDRRSSQLLLSVRINSKIFWSLA